jgi:hypothetical protein
MSRSSLELTLAPRGRKDGTWYVEIVRPGIVSEQIGDFKSKAAAEDWISQNASAYFRQQFLEEP